MPFIYGTFEFDCVGACKVLEDCGWDQGKAMDYDYTYIFESKKERNSSFCHHHPARSMERLLKTESSHVGAIGPPRKLNSIICAGLLLFCVFVIVLTGEILTNKTNYHDKASKVEAEAEKILSAISTKIPEESEITNNNRLWNTKEGKTTTSSVTAFDREDLHFEQNPRPKIKFGCDCEPRALSVLLLLLAGNKDLFVLYTLLVRSCELILSIRRPGFLRRYNDINGTTSRKQGDKNKL